MKILLYRSLFVHRKYGIYTVANYAVAAVIATYVHSHVCVYIYIYIYTIAIMYHYLYKANYFSYVASYVVYFTGFETPLSWSMHHREQIQSSPVDRTKLPI